MTPQTDSLFGGIFDRGAHGRNSRLVWRFGEPDLNTSAQQMCAHLDRLIEESRASGFVLLNTIELDVEPGRFPSLVAAYFSGSGWDYEQRFYVAPILKDVSKEQYTVGRLTFEAEVGQMAQLLAQNDGIRWGANLALGGVQVPESEVASALQRCPFDENDAAVLQTVARFAWAAGSDLDEIAAWVPIAEDHLHEKLSTLA